MFELGAKVQVLKKGLLFPGRANKLYNLYQRYNSLEEIDEKTKRQIQEKYFKRKFEEVYDEVKSYHRLETIKKAEQDPKQKMALIFRWYFRYATQLALEGDKNDKVNYQIHCGPALGSFNQWVKGTSQESWKHRHVDEIAEKLMVETANYLTSRFEKLLTEKR
jgi:trans-AT polyketide synthase/acyltransferase/oxidoreductase domain-containing protein